VTIVALTGDATTTTCVALAATWPVDEDVVVLEADPSGGSLAAWLDTPTTPTLATIVAAAGTAAPLADTVSSMTHHSAAGIRFIAAPVRGIPARRAIDEAMTTVVPALAGSPTIVLVDLGSAIPVSPIVRWARTVVVVHRQTGRSAAAESVRLERLLERIEQVAVHDADVIVAVIGTDPFEPNEIQSLVESNASGRVAAHIVLADDPLSAAVVCGRTGVSAKRLQRLPLMRSADAATHRMRRSLQEPVR
jgi:hypothetical protein